ncbi:Alpha-ketoglutarate permease [Caulifigura coniformis]|uniref:Alpha-ketoglutarate permease n=1 Tax=Caulifigura coniformis TaxID=2527983 RepID=A0A517SIY6_9PLAN|nr:MFS transporter [Caulifigura coniformis]QDT56069.1 Alpha-ketoglutarate permease [Caulifigura coniformis]
MQAADTLEPPPRSLIDRLGIHPPLVWGYVGLLLFMIGDGVEAGYLSKYLVDRNIATEDSVGLVFTAYGLAVALAAWLSGALSDLWGPRQVMAVGLAIWIAFEVGLLVLGIGPGNYALTMVMYTLRGLGYPLFAYGFLVWISVAAPDRRLGTAVGWFWFAFTGGLLALGPLAASLAIPQIGPMQTLWLSLGLVVIGGLIALLGLQEPIGKRRLAPAGEHPVRTLLSSISIAWRHPKTAIGCIVRIINTAPQNGFLVFMPIYFTKTIGFTQEQWLQMLSFMFISNVIWNLLFGIIGDKLGWRQTVAFCGGLGCTITTLLLYYVPTTQGANYPLCVLAAVLYGATLAGYVPLSALMPSLAPESKGAAMSLLNLGAGASNWVGPAIVSLFWTRYGVGTVMWIFAILYIISAVLALFLKLPERKPA